MSQHHSLGQMISGYRVTLDRECVGKAVFLTSKQLPSIFLAVPADSDPEALRSTIGESMKAALSTEKNVQVFTNGRLDGETIAVRVEFEK